MRYEAHAWYPGRTQLCLLQQQLCLQAVSGCCARPGEGRMLSVVKCTACAYAWARQWLHTCTRLAAKTKLAEKHLPTRTHRLHLKLPLTLCFEFLAVVFQVVHLAGHVCIMWVGCSQPPAALI